MTERLGSASRTTRWAAIGLFVYGLIAAAVLLLPVSYGSIIAKIDAWIRLDLGIALFGAGWIEFVANILMFVPLGFLLTILLRNHWVGVLLALLISALAELAQIVIPSRQPSARDILANVLGAAAGALLAWVLVLNRRRRASAEQMRH